MRICSLVPSATETLFALGLGEQVVGVSHECDYPPEARTRPVLTYSLVNARTQKEIDEQVRRHLAAGGIYHLNVELLMELQPDLIFTQELCEVCAVSLREVQQASRVLLHAPRLLTLDAHRLEDVLANVRLAGEATGRQREAERLVAEMRERIERVHAATNQRSERPSVLCLEWLDPPLSGGHWVPQMVELAGGRNVAGRTGERAERLTWEQIAHLDPDVIVLMPCGFDTEGVLREAAMLPAIPGWQALRAVRTGRVYAVDASAYFSRCGPRIVTGLEILAELLHHGTYAGRLPEGSYALATTALHTRDGQL